MRIATLGYAILTALLLSTPAQAQDSDEKESDRNSTRLDTVHVKGTRARGITTQGTDSYAGGANSTATGLSLTVRDTPQSVSIITRQFIDDYDLDSITDVVNVTTGVSAKELDTSRQGFSARGFDIGNLQIDGIPTSWSSGYSAGETQTSTVIYDRVEIVRGATGLLTGAGDPSAAINLVRKHANSREFTGHAQLEAGRWDHYGATVDLTTPLVPDGDIRARFVAHKSQSESYIELLEDDTTVGYGVVDADLGNSSRLSVGASYQENDPKASMWGGLPSWYSDGSRTDWPRSKTIGADWTSWASTNTNVFAKFMHRFGNGWVLDLRYDRLENDGDLKLLYVSGTVDPETGLGLNPSPSRYDNTREQDNFSFQLSGHFELFSRGHEFAIGGLHSEQDFVAERYNNGTPAAIGDFFEWDGSYPEPSWGDTYVADLQNTEQTGLYAVARLKPTNRLQAIVGTRVTDWESSGENWQGPFSLSHDSVVTPYAGLLYDINANYTGYVSYTEIFNPQNYYDRNARLLDPVTGVNYEAGLKGEWFDGRLYASAAIYRIEQENVAQPDGDFLVPGTQNQAYFEADGVVSEGYELQLTGEITPNWSLTTGWSHFQAEDADGTEVNTNHPRRIFNLYTRYRLPGNKLVIGGGVNWESENYTPATNPVTGEPERLEQDAYALVNLMARYALTDQLSAQVNVNNLLDETYYSQIGFYNQLHYGSPRNYMLKLDYRF